jgi:glycolate dehydrogenase iron-sulfur subunit
VGDGDTRMADWPGAFDALHPPRQDLIDACVHCGFCLPTCPTYVLWGEEMDSPRGRIVLMNDGLVPGSEMTDAMVTHLDRCLGCMACVTACPSGVQYGRLIEAARPQVERNHTRSRSERGLRRMVFALFPHPKRLRAVLPLLTVARVLRVDRAVSGRTARGRIPRLSALARLAPRTPVRAGAPLPERTPAVGERRGRVALLQGCVQRVFFSDVHRATIGVLAAEGYEVVAPRDPRCCGALHAHAGEEKEARVLARRTIAALEGCDLVAVNAAGCGSAMKEYGLLLEEDPRWRDRARAFSDRVRDVSEILAAAPVAGPRRPVRMRVAFHDACHLAHAQGVREQPREGLRSIPGLEIVEPKEWEICCGSAGLYNVLQPEAADALGRRKAANLLATDAEAIVAANPGCALQITTHLEAMGRPLPVYHPMELLWASIRGEDLRTGRVSPTRLGP